MDGSSPLVAKLSHFMPLSDENVRVLDALCLNEERFLADTDIVREGDVRCSAFVLTHGMAFRYRLMPDGKRQNLTFMRVATEWSMAVSRKACRPKMSPGIRRYIDRLERNSSEMH